MLSYAADGLYWVGRYMERAEHLCRLLRNQIEALEDCSIETIDRRWRRLYRSMGREPVAGKLLPSPQNEDYMFADAYTLVDDLTFEAHNPDSLRAYISSARENARHVRNALSDEMWTCLNSTYLGISPWKIQDIWNDQPSEFYARTEADIQTFIGVSNSSMYRDEGWHFLQAGRFVERVQLVAALLDSQLLVDQPDDPDALADWESLLQICQARGTFRRFHSLHYEPSQVIDILVSNPLLVHSIRHALARIDEALNEIPQPASFQAPTADTPSWDWADDCQH